jgi:phosphoglycolate phosphatase
MYNLYKENCVNKTKPYKGIIDLLDELSKQNMKMAILSNKADEMTQKTARALLPAEYFNIIAGLTDEALRKPNPQKVLQMSSEMGIEPREMIYVGDTEWICKPPTMPECMPLVFYGVLGAKKSCVPTEHEN